MIKYLSLVDDIIYLTLGKTDKVVNALITFSTLMATLLNIKFQFFPGDFMGALLFFVTLISILSLILDEVFEVRITHIEIDGITISRYLFLLPLAILFSLFSYYSIIPSLVGTKITVGTRILLALILGILSAIFHIVHRFILVITKEIIEYTGAKFTGYTLVLLTLPLFTVFSIKIMYNSFMYIATHYIL